MVGIVVGILFLVLLLVLLVASIRRIILTFRETRRIDVVAVLGLVVVILVFTCLCLALIGPAVSPIWIVD
jgi:hypothetical protein